MTLKEMRLESGLKTNKIANELGISRIQLRNLEKKLFKLSEDKVEKLAELYKRDKSEIREAAKQWVKKKSNF